MTFQQGVAAARFKTLGAVMTLFVAWLSWWVSHSAPWSIFTVFLVLLACLCAGLSLGVVAPAGTAKPRFQGTTIALPGLGKVQLTELLAKNAETEVYRADHPEVVVKMFDLSCGRADEVSYGPYMEFSLELANFEDLQNVGDLKDIIPGYYGAHIDYNQKFGFVAMEYLEGTNLSAWCEEAAQEGYQGEWVEAFQETIYETLSIMRVFHKHDIILIDFKPDDILRLPDKRIKFVDLGAFFTPRQAQATQKYVYSTTPDHAELIIDSSNVPTGVPLTKASDIFSAGVALFEMATGASRLAIDGATADEILSLPEIYQFRNSQIRGVWHANPNLKEVLPLLDAQLRERRLLFSEFWPVLKGYVRNKMEGWDTLEPAQQDQIILTTGTTFILEQLPAPLQWLAGPIAQATALRGLRPKSVAELMKLLERPAPEQAREDLDQFNGLVQFLRDLEPSLSLPECLNGWDVRLDPTAMHWAVSSTIAHAQAGDNSPFTFLKQAACDADGNRFYTIVDELEADDVPEGKLTLGGLRNDHFAWIR